MAYLYETYEGDIMPRFLAGPEDSAAEVARLDGLGVGGYLAVLAVLFFSPPLVVLLARRYKWSERIKLEGLKRHVASLERVKGLMLQNRELSRRPLNQQLEAFLYSRTNYGLVLDVIQASLSLVSCGLVIHSATFPFTEPEPAWAVVTEIALTVYFAADYSLRFFLAQDRLSFYFSPLSLLDYITIVPGLVQIVLSASAFDPQAFIVSQTLRVFRIFRAVRLLRIVALSTSSSLTRQIMVLAVTVLAIVFAAAAIFQILDSTPQKFVPFHVAVLYMTITIIGRPPIPTQTDAAKVFETLAIYVGSFVIPAFIAELARLYFEQQGREVYASDPRVPHVILCGDVNTSRLRAFLVQFFHKSRDPELLSPVVVLNDAKYEGPLKTLIEQSRYAGSVKYIRGSARRPADLKRAAAGNASTVIVLCHRTSDMEAGAADAEVVSAALAVKNINRRVRILAQLRRARGREHLMCLPGWRDAHDRGVAVSSLGMTLVGVGALIPGLPTLLTNLIHQGNKNNARSSNPRRRKYIADRGKKFGLQPQAAGMIVAASTPWWAAPLTGALEVLEHTGNALLGKDSSQHAASEEDVLEQLTRPMTAMEEYTSGFAQEMFAFAVTPGLARRSFATAARLAYLRYGVLLIGARVPLEGADAGGAASPGAPVTPSPAPARPGSDPSALFRVLLFPADLELKMGMYLHAIAFDTLDLAALLQGTGGEAAARALAATGSTSPVPPGLTRTPSHVALDASGAASPVPALSGTASGVESRSHNSVAAADLSVPWCFTEQQEDAAEAVLAALENAGEDAGKRMEDAAKGELPFQLTVHRCSCGQNHSWAKGQRTVAEAAAQAATEAAQAAAAAAASSRGDGSAPGRVPVAPPPAILSPGKARRMRASSDADDGFGPGAISSLPVPGVRAAAGEGGARIPGSAGRGLVLPGEVRGPGGVGGYGGDAGDGELDGEGTIDGTALDEEEEEEEEGGEEDEDEEDVEGGYGEADMDGDIGVHEEAGDGDTVSGTGSISRATSLRSGGAGALAGSGHHTSRAHGSGDAPRSRGPGAPTRSARMLTADTESVFTAGDDGLGGEADDAVGIPHSVSQRGAGLAGGARSSAALTRRSISRRIKTALNHGASRDGRTAQAGSAEAGSSTGRLDVGTAPAGSSAHAGHRPGVLSGGGSAHISPASALLPVAGPRAAAFAGRAAGAGAGALPVGPIPLFAQAYDLRPVFPFLFARVGPAGRAALVAAATGVVSRPLPPAASSTGFPTSPLTPYSGHILVCGMSEAIGLLLRALQMPAPTPPVARVPGLATAVSEQVARLAEARNAAGALNKRGAAGGAGGVAASGGAGVSGAVPIPIVALCSVNERPSDAMVNAMHPGSSRYLSRVTWVNGSPLDMGELLRAGVETARAAIVLSTKRPQANSDGNDNLADDTDAIVVASAIYKLNPRLHIVTEVIHGPHASYLRPCGTSLTDAEDSTSAFIHNLASAPAVEETQAVQVKPGGPSFVGPAPKIAAPSDIFGAPAFAAGRAFSSTTLDALMCEAHFSPHIVMIIGHLVRASRRQRLQLLPVADAIAMGMLVAPPMGAGGEVLRPHGIVPEHGRAPSVAESNGSLVLTLSEDVWGPTAAGAVHTRRQLPRETVSAAAQAARPRPMVQAVGATAALLAAPNGVVLPSSGSGCAAPSAVGTGLRGAGASSAPSSAIFLPELRTYGQLFESLLRGWNLLAVGLYRRVQPGVLPAPPVVRDPVAQFTAAFAPGGSMSQGGAPPSGPGGLLGGPFRNEKGLVSYVFTNPPPDAVLNYQDYVYVLRPGGEDDEE